MSWKGVVDKHGPRVAFAALKAGTIPFIMHRLLNEGHDVPWPDSHQFVITDQHWSLNWKETFNLDAVDEAEAKRLEQQLLNEQCIPGLKAQAWETIAGSFEHEIPTNPDDGEQDAFPNHPAGSANAPSPMSKGTKAVHPDYSGTAYDEQPTKVTDGLKSIFSTWPRKCRLFEGEIAKAQ